MKGLKLYIALLAFAITAHAQATLNGSTVKLANIPPSAIAGSCISSTGSDTYTCTVSSQLVYTNGMSMNFRATGAVCTGPATINMSSKGAKNLYASDGTSDPACTTNQDYRINYDSSLNSGAGGWKMPVIATSTAQLHSITFVIDGGGAAITTGALGVFGPVDFACTISRYDVTANASGSITVDIWKHASGTIPTSSDKISASAPITLSSAQLAQAGSLTGWTTSVSVGDIFGGTVATSSTVQKVTATIWCQ